MVSVASLYFTSLRRADVDLEVVASQSVLRPDEWITNRPIRGAGYIGLALYVANTGSSGAVLEGIDVSNPVEQPARGLFEDGSYVQYIEPRPPVPHERDELKGPIVHYHLPIADAVSADGNELIARAHALKSSNFFRCNVWESQLSNSRGCKAPPRSGHPVTPARTYAGFK